MTSILLRAAPRTVLICACVLVSACGLSLSRPAIVKHYYLLQVAEQPGETAPAHAVAIKVNGFEVAPPFADRVLVYRVEDQRYESDFYNEFFVAPRAMVTSRVSEWLATRHIFSNALPPSSSIDAPYAIEGLVNAMYGDLRNSAEPSAVFTMQVYVMQSGAGERRIVLERTYSHQVRVSDTSAENVAKGLSLALQQCLADLETDLRAADIK
jgi:cholesterol transport system auxiliary component